MNQIATTMPEVRLRRTKKKVQPIRSSVSSQQSPATAPAKQTPTKSGSEIHLVDKSQTVKPQPAKAKAAKRQPGAALAAWWPVGVALFLNGFIPEWVAMAQQLGQWGMRIAFPLSLIASHTEIGISAQLAATLPHTALYLQMPLDGLLMKITMGRGKSLKAAIAQFLLVHAVCAFVLWLITFAPK